MKKAFNSIYLFILILPFITSCDSTARLYRTGEKNKISDGILDDITYNSIREFLISKNRSSLNDTIIIKYDYNHESCWNALDEKEDGYIMKIVSAQSKQIQTLTVTRPNVSVFHFREPGKNFNKLIKWNGSILIDSSKKIT